MKKYSWIVALLAALALVLVGCGDDGGGQQGGQEGGEELVDLVITDAAAIGALLAPGGADNADVTKTNNTLVFAHAGTGGSIGFHLQGLDGVDFGEFELDDYSTVGLTVEIVAFTGPQLVKFTSKTNTSWGTDLPGVGHGQYIQVGDASTVGHSTEFKYSIAALTNNMISFQHNNHQNPSDPTQAGVNYTIKVTNVTFYAP